MGAVHQAVMRCLCSTESGWYECDCEVRVEGESIFVSYENNGAPNVVLYEGKAKGPGHYYLECHNPKARATLHCFENSKILEGWWEEGGEDGMWRISFTD